MRMIRLLALAVIPSIAAAQAAAPAAPVVVPPADEQIAAAVLPLPEQMRAGATVMGFKTAGKLEVLRPGTNGMHCLALYVMRPDFHVACYHKGLEDFMARGRSVREQLGARANVDSVRYKEIAEGKLTMPAQGALYSITVKKENWNATTRTVSQFTPLSVVYVPGATEESTGLSKAPQKAGTPWLMFPGTPKAHIMLQGTMTP
jgi:hypothetical protein